MSVTLKDVARQAGVSPATVSLVINGDERISAETREKVLACIRSLGYRMNNLARGLKTNKTNTIGFVTPDLTNTFFMNVAKGVEHEIRKYGYSMIICSSNERIEEEKDRMELLIDRAVDGIIVIPSTHQGGHIVSGLPDGLPVVLVDRFTEGFSTDTVLVDNVNGTYNAVEQLIQSGSRRIGFIGGDPLLTSAKERLEGYRRALLDYALPEDPGLVLFGDYHAESGYALTKQLMESENAPDALFVANYYMHLGTMEYLLQTKGTSAEPAIIVASFDDLELSRLLGVDGIRIRQPMAEIGSTAAALLYRRMNGDKDRFPEIIRLKTEIVHHV